MHFLVSEQYIDSIMHVATIKSSNFALQKTHIFSSTYIIRITECREIIALYSGHRVAHTWADKMQYLMGGVEYEGDAYDNNCASKY